MLNFQNLDVYRCGIEFLALAVKIQGQLGKGDAELRDQLRRAALSIPLNVAEASGKVGANDRARFFAIARGSTMECGAILDCIEIINPCCLEEIARCRPLLQRIVEMLSKLCRPNS
jgi:four helix bundle protein